MTQQEKTLALVLGVAPYAETTLLVRLLTARQGVVRALAKGARRQAKRGAPQAAFEPLALIEAGLRVKGHDALGTLGEVRLVRDWPGLRRDLARFAYGALGIEVLGMLAADSPADAGLMERGVEFLERMETTGAAGSLTIALLLGMLHEAGFAPRLAEGLEQSALPATLAWSFEDSRFAAIGPVTSLGALRVPGKAVAALGEGLDSAPAMDGTFEVPAAQGKPLLRWLIRVWEDHLHTQLRAADFLEKMVFKAAT